jgi:hypothetical protein
MMKKDELIKLMTSKEHIDKFRSIKPKSKPSKPAPKPSKPAPKPSGGAAAPKPKKKKFVIKKKAETKSINLQDKMFGSSLKEAQTDKAEGGEGIGVRTEWKKFFMGVLLKPAEKPKKQLKSYKKEAFSQYGFMTRRKDLETTRKDFISQAKAGVINMDDNYNVGLNLVGIAEQLRGVTFPEFLTLMKKNQSNYFDYFIDWYKDEKTAPIIKKKKEKPAKKGSIQYILDILPSEIEETLFERIEENFADPFSKDAIKERDKELKQAYNTLLKKMKTSKPPVKAKNKEDLKKIWKEVWRVTFD